MTNKYFSFLFLLIGGLLMTAQNSSAQSKPLSPDEEAPAFTAKASLDGEEFNFSLQEALSEGPVVVYFFPSAYTKGCDIEARTFSENIDKFKKADATIIGVSADNIERLNQFSADPEYCAGNFSVASDPNGKIAAKYGLDIMRPEGSFTDVNGETVDHGFIPRTTFVINTNGKIVATYSSKYDDIGPVEHVMKSLSTVQGL